MDPRAALPTLRRNVDDLLVYAFREEMSVTSRRSIVLEALAEPDLLRLRATDVVSARCLRAIATS